MIDISEILEAQRFAFNTFSEIKDLEYIKNRIDSINESNNLSHYKDLFKRYNNSWNNLKIAYNKYNNALSKINGIYIEKEKFDDIIKILNVMYPQSIKDVDKIIDYFINNFNNDFDLCKEVKASVFGKNSSKRDISMTTLYFETIRVIGDITDSLKAYKKLSATNRLSNNKYKSDSKRVFINIAQILNDIDNCKKNIETFNSKSNKIEHIFSSNTSFSEIFEKHAEKIVILIELLLDYYASRLNILNIVVSYTKEFSSDKEYEYNINTSLKTAELKRDYISIDIQKFHELEDLTSSMRKLNKDGNFLEYKKLHNKVCDILKIKHGVSFAIITNDAIKEGNNYKIYIAYDITPEQKIDITNKTLYHCSKNSNIKEIKPNCYSSDINMYFPEPRIYFHISFPLDKFGKEINADTNTLLRAFGDTDYNDSNKYYAFEIENNFKSAYHDFDIGFNAAYIVSNKPIKVIKKIDLNDFYELNNFARL